MAMTTTYPAAAVVDPTIDGERDSERRHAIQLWLSHQEPHVPALLASVERSESEPCRLNAGVQRRPKKSGGVSREAPPLCVQLRRGWSLPADCPSHLDQGASGKER